MAGAVNPARAGMILSGGIGVHGARGKPRASGDDPEIFGGLVKGGE